MCKSEKPKQIEAYQHLVPSDKADALLVLPSLGAHHQSTNKTT